jgi:hypothetical protein
MRSGANAECRRYISELRNRITALFFLELPILRWTGDHTGMRLKSEHRMGGRELQQHQHVGGRDQ